MAEEAQVKGINSHKHSEEWERLRKYKEKRERAFCHLDVLLRMLIAGLERVLLMNQHNEEGQEEALESHY